MIKEPAKKDPHAEDKSAAGTGAESFGFYDFSKVYDSIFPLIQRFYLAYVFLLGGVFLLIWGLQLIFQSGFSFLFPQSVPVLTEISFLGLIFLLLVWFCSLLDNVVHLFLDAFHSDLFAQFRRFLLGKPRDPIWEKRISITIVLLCDFVPVFTALGTLAVQNDLRDATDAWFLAVIVVGSILVLLQWFVSLCRDYVRKVRFIYALSKGSLDGYAVTSSPPPVHMDTTHEHAAASGAAASVSSPATTYVGSPIGGSNSESLSEKSSKSGRKATWIARIVIAVLLIILLIVALAMQNTVYTILVLTLCYFSVVVFLVSMKIPLPDGDASGSHAVTVAASWITANCGIRRVLVIRTSILCSLVVFLLLVAAFYFQSYYALVSIFASLSLLAIYLISAFRLPRRLPELVVWSSAVVCPLIILFSFAGVSWKTGVFSLILVIFTQGFLQQKGKSFLVFFTIYMLILTLLVGIVVAFGFGASQAAPTYSTSGSDRYAYPARNPYVFCKYQLPLNLTIVDYVLAAQLIYRSESNVQKDMQQWFAGWSNFQLIHRSSDDSSAFFLHLEDPVARRNIISVRGTVNGRDTAEDLAVWMPAVLYSTGSTLIPTGAMMQIVRALQFMLKALHPYDPYYQKVVDYVRGSVLSKYSTAEVAITGHSLGAGIGGIVAGLTGVQAVTFSSPGLRYTSYLIENLSRQSLRQVWTTLIPENDIIPSFDQTIPDATIFSIRCPYSMLGCHLITTITCELFEGCGDIRNRGINAHYCVPEF